MKDFTVVRVILNNYGTFSVFAYEDQFLGNILEPVFPILARDYVACYTWHPKHKQCYELQMVPGHTAILIHAGNTKLDTEGCLIPGRRIDKIWGGIGKPFTWLWGVAESRKALAAFMDIAGHEDISVSIRESFYKPESMGVV
jgi:hypothetical protein